MQVNINIKARLACIRLEHIFWWTILKVVAFTIQAYIVDR